MRRWSFFNAELTRSTLVDDCSADGSVIAARGFDHVPRVGGGDLDGLQGTADRVEVGSLALGPLLLDHPDLDLDNLEGMVQLHVADAVRCAAFAHHTGTAVVSAARRRRPSGCGVERV